MEFLIIYSVASTIIFIIIGVSLVYDKSDLEIDVEHYKSVADFQSKLKQDHYNKLLVQLDEVKSLSNKNVLLKDEILLLESKNRNLIKENEQLMQLILGMFIESLVKNKEVKIKKSKK